MKIKMLLLFAALVSSVIVLACSEVVFPTPLPTATPAPTATPIVFPTPLPTATPFAVVFPTHVPTATPAPTATPSPVPTASPISVVFPTPLPTATPFAVVFPTHLPTATPAPTSTPIAVPIPLPTATPLSVVFPTPLPTATPAPTSTPIAISRPGNRSTDSPAFLYIEAARVMPLNARENWGVGFRFASNHPNCRGKACLIAPKHVVSEYRGFGTEVRDGSAYRKGVRLSGGASDQDASLDIAVVPAGPISDVPALDGLTKWAFAPRDSVEVGDSVRVVTFDFHAKERTDEGVAIQIVLDGIVSRITKDGEEFMLTTSTLKGNSGGVVLNEDMQVIGMVKAALQYRHPFGAAPEDIPFRTYAVHVDAIRDKLCEWGYLTGSDCR